MRADHVQINGVYEARVPIQGSMKEKKAYRLVKVVGMGDSILHGDAQMVAVIYAAPMAPRGRGIALISPLKLRLPRRRPSAE